MHPARLTDCPVCHGALDGAAAQCPSCSTELAPYYELLMHANTLVCDAYNAALRGDAAKGRELAQKAIAISPLLAEQHAELQARIALLEHRFEDALAEAGKLQDVGARAALEAEIAASFDNEMHAKEHFNLALTAAREGRLAAAEYHISQSLELAPHLDSVWRMAVMIALKRQEFDKADKLLGQAIALFPSDPFLSSVYGK